MKKIEHVRPRRLNFAGQYVCIENNFGKFNGSLARQLGLTKSEAEMLKRRDAEMERSSNRGHWFNKFSKIKKGTKDVIEYSYGFDFESPTPLDDLLDDRDREDYRTAPNPSDQ